MDSLSRASNERHGLNCFTDSWVSNRKLKSMGKQYRHMMAIGLNGFLHHLKINTKIIK